MRRVVIIACALLVAAIVGGASVWRWSQRGPGRASVGTAVERFRTSSTVPAVAGTLQPRPGVYIYRGSGTETLSFLHTRQTQGPTEPGTVSALANGCWSFQIDFNSFHSQKWIRCPVDGKLVERGGTADQKFDFLAFKESEHSVTTCAPPIVLVNSDATPGSTSPVHCTGQSRTTGTRSVQTGTLTFVGRETVDVGGARVPAVHARQDVRLSGGQTGTVRVDIWLSAADGLPLREQHTIVVTSSAPPPINHVTYDERGQWSLTSVTPRN